MTGRVLHISEDQGWDGIITALKTARQSVDSAYRIEITAGQYEGTEPLLIPSGVTMIGSGDATQLIFKGHDSALQIIEAANVTLERFSLHYDGQAPDNEETDNPDDDLGAIQTERSLNCRLKALNLSSKNQGIHGVFSKQGLEHCYDEVIINGFCNGLTLSQTPAAIQSCQISNAGLNGISAWGKNTQTELGEGLHIKSCIVKQSEGNGIIVGGVNAVLTDNLSSQNKESGIGLQRDFDRPDDTDFEITLTGNQSCKNENYGILVFGINAVLEDNQCSQNKRHGISLQRDSDRRDDTDFEITLTGNQSCNNKNSGILVSGVDAVLTGNLSCQNKETGIVLQRYPERPDDTNFVITLAGNQSCDNGHSGIVVFGVNAVLADNLCSQNKETGIFLQRYPDRPDDTDFEITLTGNQSCENESTGIGVYGVNAVLANNLCSQNKESGIFLHRDINRPDDTNFKITLAGNQSCDNGHSGIVVFGVNAVLADNLCSQNKNNGITLERYPDRPDDTDFEITLTGNQSCENESAGIGVLGVNAILTDNLCSQNKNIGLALYRSSHRQEHNNFTISLKNTISSGNLRQGLSLSGVNALCDNLQSYDNGAHALYNFWPNWGNYYTDNPSWELNGSGNILHAHEEAVFQDPKLPLNSGTFEYETASLSTPGIFYNIAPQNLNLAALDGDIAADAKLVWQLDQFTKSYLARGLFASIWTEERVSPELPEPPKFGAQGYKYKLTAEGNGDAITRKAVPSPSGEPSTWLPLHFDRLIAKLRPHTDSIRKTRLSIMITPDPQDASDLAEHIRLRSLTAHGSWPEGPNDIKAAEALAKNYTEPSIADDLNIAPALYINSPPPVDESEAGNTSGDTIFDTALREGQSIGWQRVKALASHKFLTLALGLILLLAFLPVPLIAEGRAQIWAVLKGALLGKAPLSPWRMFFGSMGIFTTGLISLRLLNSLLPRPIKFGASIMDMGDKGIGSPFLRQMLQIFIGKLEKNINASKIWTQWAQSRLYAGSDYPVMIIDDVTNWRERDIEALSHLVGPKDGAQGLWVVVTVPGRSFEAAAIDKITPLFDEAELYYGDTEDRISIHNQIAPANQTAMSLEEMRDAIGDLLGFASLKDENAAYVNDLCDYRFNLYDMWTGLVLGAAVQNRPILSSKLTTQTIERNEALLGVLQPYYELFVNMTQRDQPTLDKRLDRSDATFEAGRTAIALRHHYDSERRSEQFLEGRPSQRAILYKYLSDIWPTDGHETLPFKHYMAFGLACGIYDALEKIQASSLSISTHNVNQKIAAWHSIGFLMSEAESLLGRAAFFDLFPTLRDTLKDQLISLETFLKADVPLDLRAQAAGLSLRAMPREAPEVLAEFIDYLAEEQKDYEPVLAFRRAEPILLKTSYGWTDEFHNKMRKALEIRLNKTPSLAKRISNAATVEEMQTLLENHKSLGERLIYVACLSALATLGHSSTDVKDDRSKLYNALIELRDRTRKDQRHMPPKLTRYEASDIVFKIKSGHSTVDLLCKSLKTHTL
ncbi:MAG: right-handed parallel beta-helix repeat-containing protein [Maricaulaceae bacterium]